MVHSCRLSRRALIQGFSASLVGIPSLGCGTILYPERRGQPAGDFDWKVVALDAVGLLFFFVPGVVAFAVDFSNGTIYLPPEECADSTGVTAEELAMLTIPKDQLNVRGIESAVSARTEKEVRLAPGKYQTHKLAHLNDFWKFRAQYSAS